MSLVPRRWSPIARRFVPFVLVGFVALATVLIPPAPESWSLVGVAALLSVLVALVGLTVPWERVPRWTYVVPPLAYLPVVAVLREALGGAASGYSALALLPVVWVALNLGRRELALIIVSVTALFVFPLVAVGGEQYPASEWRRAAVSTLVAVIVGFAVQTLVSQRRAQARRAELRAQELGESEATIAAVARIARTDWSQEDSRAVICQAALEVSAGRVVTIVEPGLDGQLVITASAGHSFPPTALPQSVVPSGSVVAYRSGRRHVVTDAQHDPAVPRAIAEATGIESVLYEPILRDGTPIGVLAVGWAAPYESVAASTRTAVELLAAEASRAIERADLLISLERLAGTDGLTGLPNRRSWELRLPELVAAAHGRQQRLCVAVIDLDRFKLFNDRNGHQSGDAFLRQCARAWQECVRHGDLLARYGGEEFALALPLCGLDEGASVLGRLRRATPLGQTCSIGIAELQPGETPDALVGRADRALYEAKHDGRNRLVVARAA